MPGGKNYLVLRDTMAGGQPTQWQFWTLSRGVKSLDGGIAGKSLDEQLDGQFLESVVQFLDGHPRWSEVDIEQRAFPPVPWLQQSVLAFQTGV